MLAGQAFANSPVAAVHALAYPIGGHFGVPHGLSNALVLPHVLRFNASACAESYAALAPHAFPELTHASADAFIEAVAALAADLRLPPRLRDVGIPADAVPMHGGGRHEADAASREQPAPDDPRRRAGDLRGGLVKVADETRRPQQRSHRLRRSQAGARGLRDSATALRRLGSGTGRRVSRST